MMAAEELSPQGEYLEEMLVDGVVKAIDGEQVVVGLSATSDGVVPMAELARAGVKPEVGAPLRIFVDRRDAETSRWILSREKADRLAVYDRITHAFEKHELVTGTVVAAVEGGFSVDIGVKAFCPGSQIDLFGGRDVDRWLDQTFEFRIIRFQKNRGNIVVSRRVLLEEQRAKTMERVYVGAVLEGVVKSVVDYGAFVDLGGVQGLLHVSDMSWGRVGHPTEIVDVGDKVRVKVLKLDNEKGRISLGIRQLQEDPWLDAQKRYAVGTTVKGTVVSITDYGVFLELEPGVEGLVHATGPNISAAVSRDLLRRTSIGDVLEAQVLETDLAKKRISLRPGPTGHPAE
ncbi:S1 RNA-binding domain-containing protein [Myxococcota bacterium]|nr:S1 RNA-binding domain-containing protein [Myxococcota bacterium]